MLDYDEDDDTEEISDANDDYDDDIAYESGRYEDDDLNNEEEEERIREKEIKLQKESDAYSERLVYFNDRACEEIVLPRTFFISFLYEKLV